MSNFEARRYSGGFDETGNPLKLQIKEIALRYLEKMSQSFLPREGISKLRSWTMRKMTRTPDRIMIFLLKIMSLVHRL